MAVAQESSIVRFNGVAEQIVMRLSVRTQAHDAAWLMPTPSRASVSLGKAAWFDELDGLATPKVVKHHRLWPSLSLGSGNERATSSAARPPGVTVLGQQRLGPFQGRLARRRRPRRPHPLAKCAWVPVAEDAVGVVAAVRSSALDLHGHQARPPRGLVPHRHPRPP